MNQKPLRFAALIRVSTERQEKQGESLRTQETQINQAVEQLAGKITARYVGQEHATAGYERQLVEKLLSNATAAHRKFDAVIVADPSRWSRDNVASETGLEKLKANGIRFFVLTQEYDLFDPNARLFLSLSTTIGSFHAAVQKQKSMWNRILRAKRGIPTGGKLPFGRTFDRATNKWGIDESKRKQMAEVAARYLAGESLADIACDLGVNHANLHKNLTRRCGPLWENKFRSEDLNIDETVEIQVPSLLPPKTLGAIQRRVHANKTYQHGQPKNTYLLSGMVFCGACGYVMFGQTNRNGHRYYRHSHKQRDRECECVPRPWVRADQLEDAVVRRLFETFGNPTAARRAIEQATPDLTKSDDLLEELRKLKLDIEKWSKKRERITALIFKDLITDEDAEVQLTKIKQKALESEAEKEWVEAQLEALPSAQKIKADAEEIVRQFARRPVSAKRRMVLKEINSRVDLMTWEDKHSLVKQVFNDTTAKGKPFGVYVEAIEGQSAHRQKKWGFTLRGIPPITNDGGVTQCASR
jgi:site-specific DNA recombinase